MRRSIRKYRRPLVVGLHIALIVLANFGAFWLRFDGVIPEDKMLLWARMLPWLVIIRGLLFIPFRLYEGLWRYVGIWDLRNIVAGVFSGTVVFYLLVHWGVQLAAYPRSIFIIDSLLLIFTLGGARLIWRASQGRRYATHGKRVLIYGAGDA
jgi:FlaA1/EpsC-like NDP-sugar epimerase